MPNFKLKQTSEQVQKAIDNALYPDKELTKEGVPADSKAVGIEIKKNSIHIGTEAPANGETVWIDTRNVSVKYRDPKTGTFAEVQSGGSTDDGSVKKHNESETAHEDIRLLLAGLSGRLNAIADSDDTTLDQLSEIVAYIKANKTLIESVTTSKVDVSDIIDNLTTSVSNKPLSAKMGVELRRLISTVENSANNAMSQASSAQSMASSAMNHASSAEEIASSAEQMASAAMQRASSAEQMASAAQTEIEKLKENGVPGGGASVEIDDTLTVSGAAADAAAVGEELKNKYSAENEPPYPVESVCGKTGAVSLTAGDVGADPSGRATGLVEAHNISGAAHNDIRLLISGLTTRLNALADSDDTTLDQLSEIVEYIKANKSLIDSITTSKVSVADIIDNLTTSVSNKPLSAKMGVELKKLIDAIKIPTSLPASDVPNWAKQPTKPTYTKSEVGLGNVDNVRQYSASNQPPYPVTSVNGQTGAVTVTADGIGAATAGQVKELTETIADQQKVIDSSVLFTAQTLTEAQKAQARANIGATAGEDVEFADSVEWLNENGDTSKKYVLPDGYIYAWLYKEETVEHNANDGTGWTNYRPQSTWGNTKGTASGVWTSPIIYIDPTSCAPTSDRLNESEVVISGLEKIVPAFNSSAIWVFYYKADGSQYTAKKGSQLQSVGKDTEISLPLSFYLKDTGTFADSNWATIQGVRICIGVSTSGDIAEADVKNLKVNMPFFNQETSGYNWHSTGQQHSNDKATQQNSADIATLKEEVADLKEAVQKSPSVSGAAWYAIGDSITYGLYSTSATEYFQPVIGQRWVDYVAKYNGYELINLGKSNAGFLTSPTFRSMVDGADFANADIVTIMLGINDWKYESTVDKVGTMDDDISTGGTIVSELRYGLEKIIADNPYCKIILITPINAKIGGRGTEATNWAYGYSGTSTPTPCGSLKNFGDKLKEVCDYYGVQVVDMSNSSVVNRKSITTVLPDGIHPNLECYKALGLELARRITFA